LKGLDGRLLDGWLFIGLQHIVEVLKIPDDVALVLVVS
jgi:hypothetical protein